jgi:hypothetical protein
VGDPKFFDRATSAVTPVTTCQTANLPKECSKTFSISSTIAYSCKFSEGANAFVMYNGGDGGRRIRWLENVLSVT